MRHDDEEFENVTAEEIDGNPETDDEETDEYIHVEWAGFI